jgi:hypothetical protein
LRSAKTEYFFSDEKRYAKTTNATKSKFIRRSIYENLPFSIFIAVQHTNQYHSTFFVLNCSIFMKKSAIFAKKSKIGELMDKNRSNIANRQNALTANEAVCRNGGSSPQKVLCKFGSLPPARSSVEAATTPSRWDVICYGRTKNRKM